MDRISRWKLADELNAYQIALLIAGYDPSEFERDHPDMWPAEVKLDIAPFVYAIKNAARSKRILMTPIHFDNSYNDDIDWQATTINIDSLCEWMRLRNFQDGFFIDLHGEIDTLADMSGEFYAPKLAAAVRAWKEVTADREALNGKTPKKALEVWLRKHSNEYGLTSKDGNPNGLGIEEICKVANWKPAGGASPTPVKQSTLKPVQVTKPGWVRKARPDDRHSSPTRRLNPPTPLARRLGPVIDDDIPF